MKKNKDKLLFKYKNNELLQKFTVEEIMIIASIVEKEGKN